MPDQYQTAPDQNFESLVPAMNPKKSHRWIVWIVGLIFLIVLATAAYFLFLAKSPSSVPPPQSQSDNSPKILLSEKVISPILSFDGEKIWFMTVDGEMFRLQTDGSGIKEEFSLPSPTYGVIRVIWQEDANDFLLEYLSGGHTRYKYYDSQNDRFVEYPEQMREIGFSSAGINIVYDWVTATSTHELKVSLPSGDGFRTVSELFRPDYKIASSPRLQKVILFRDDQGDPSNLILINLATANFQDLDEKAAYSDVSFAPDGSKVLALKNGRVVIYDVETLQKKDLFVTAEIGQISWSEDSEKVIVGSADGFREYDAATGGETVLYQFDDPSIFVPLHPILHIEKSELYFVDEPTGYLYKINLE